MCVCMCVYLCVCVYIIITREIIEPPSPNILVHVILFGNVIYYISFWGVGGN